MTKTISTTGVLPNGVLVPHSFQPERMDENALKEQHCQTLKAELALELNRSNFKEIEALFEERGNDFLIEMFAVDPWQNVNNKGKSILENVLQEIKFNLPDDILRFLLNYYIDQSEQAKTTNMNLLHVLARNCFFCSKAMSMLESVVAQQPHLLKERMTLEAGLDMTPVEMTIRTSYNEKLMNYMLTKYQESVGVVTSADKEKLLSHAQWLSGSGVYHTALMGKRLMERIKAL